MTTTETPPSDQYYPGPCSLCGHEFRCKSQVVALGDSRGWFWKAEVLLCLDCRSQLDGLIKDFLSKRPDPPTSVGEPDDSKNSN